MDVAIPVFRISCGITIDKGRAWNIVDELLLWSVARSPQTMSALAREANLPLQLIVASVARLMRFRLVEVVRDASGVAFGASDYGLRNVRSGNPLPFIPKRYPRRINFLIDRTTGAYFLGRGNRTVSPHKLQENVNAGADIRLVQVEGGGPQMTHEAHLNRLFVLAARGWDEELASVDHFTAQVREEYLMIRVIDGVPTNIPEGATPDLRAVIHRAAGLPAGSSALSVTYAGEEEFEGGPVSHVCSFDSRDLIVGGSAHRATFVDLLRSAHRRAIIHSTFLDVECFLTLFDDVRAACRRGVEFDVFWGAEYDDETEKRNSAVAAAIMLIIGKNEDTAGRFRVHLTSTGSHAKLVMVDTPDGDWIGAVGSCNWLSSPYRNVELSVVLRTPNVVADVAAAFQRVLGQRGLANGVATEIGLVARDLRKRVSPGGGNASITIVLGDAHHEITRAASGQSKRWFVVGCHKLGATARPGAVMLAEVAAKRAGVEAVVFYSQSAGPIKNRHAKELAEEATASGVALVKTRKIPLHGKFVAWDADDLLVTSLNWASASTNADFPASEVGVHIHAPSVATLALSRLIEIYPELKERLRKVE